jgi:uncharacterized protein (TIGR02246 family)
MEPATRSDEEQIRGLVTSWMAATKAGDIDALLASMAEDVVFLVPGQPPMTGKTGFAALQKAQWARGVPDFEATSEILEIKVLGEWAFMWTKLAIVITPPGASQPMTRAGHTLSILRKERGKWVLARDANLLVPTSPST